MKKAVTFALVLAPAAYGRSPSTFAVSGGLLRAGTGAAIGSLTGAEAGIGVPVDGVGAAGGVLTLLRHY